jgi:hypothetical protein
MSCAAAPCILHATFLCTVYTVSLVKLAAAAAVDMVPLLSHRWGLLHHSLTASVAKQRGPNLGVTRFGDAVPTVSWAWLCAPFNLSLWDPIVSRCRYSKPMSFDASVSRNNLLTRTAKQAHNQGDSRTCLAPIARAHLTIQSCCWRQARQPHDLGSPWGQPPHHFR